MGEKGASNPPSPTLALPEFEQEESQKASDKRTDYIDGEYE